MSAYKRSSKSQYNLMSYICFLFLFLCFIPFLFPNPIAITNIQPYATIAGLLIIVFKLFLIDRVPRGRSYFIIALLTFFVALCLLFLREVSISAFRAVYNYLAVLVVPTATCISLVVLNQYPERFIKAMILMWFIVSTIQFFIYRGFMTSLISGANWSLSYRGVVGLASEPSFFGIACFYFLHMVCYFRTHRALFVVITLIMSVIYAQSAMGILFIAGYFVVFLFDNINSRKGFVTWITAIAGMVIFLYVLNTFMTDTRLYQIYTDFVEGGVDNVLEDSSADTRFNSISGALSAAFENYLLPAGFSDRIGSGFGGFLVELGIFSLPVLFCISQGMARTFNKLRSVVLYFVVITFLLFNNTQLGNPLLLVVIGINLWMSDKYEKEGVVVVEKRNNLPKNA